MTLARALRMRIKRIKCGDRNTREFPICISPICGIANLIHAWKYECNTRDFKSMRGLRVAGFFKYNMNYPA